METVLKGGRLISGERMDVSFENGKIKKVSPDILITDQQVIDISDHYFSAGWIDDHVHAFEEMTLYYDYPDQIGVEKGVTSLIDAGSTGAENIGRFHELALKAKTNVFALVNISKFGIVEQDELVDLSKVQADLVKDVIKKYPDFIVGLKARMSKTVVGENGITPLMLAKEIQSENNDLPLMVHIGSQPPSLEEILDVVEKGDVITHCFNGKPNGILAEDGTIKEVAFDAYRNGVIFDIGHGTDSFNFNVANRALNEDMKSHTISSDIYNRNRINGPVYDLATTMEKLSVVGYSWPEIIDQVTKNPAQHFNLEGKGQLAEGFDADFTVFDFVEEEKVLTDSNGNEEITKTQIKPIKTIIGGVLYDN